MPTVFRLDPSPTFRAVVPIPIPGGDPAELEFEFRHKTRDSLKHWLGSFSGRTEADVLADVIVAWHNADGAYSAQALDKLLQDYPQAGGAILAAYTRELTGARLGN